MIKCIICEKEAEFFVGGDSLCKEHKDAKSNKQQALEGSLAILMKKQAQNMGLME